MVPMVGRALLGMVRMVRMVCVVVRGGRRCRLVFGTGSDRRSSDSDEKQQSERSNQRLHNKLLEGRDATVDGSLCHRFRPGRG